MDLASEYYVHIGIGLWSNGELGCAPNYAKQMWYWTYDYGALWLWCQVRVTHFSDTLDLTVGELDNGLVLINGIQGTCTVTDYDSIR